MIPELQAKKPISDNTRKEIEMSEKKILPILFVLLVLIQPNAILMAETETKDFYLSNISAKDAGKALQKNFSELSPQPDIVVNEQKNSLTVIATRNVLEQIDKKLKEIDVIRPQIMVEAMVAEIPSSEMDKCGINWTNIGMGGIILPGEAVPAIENKFANISPETFQALKKKLETGEIKGNIITAPRIMVIDQTQGTIKIGGEVHYMEKVGDKLYELRTEKENDGFRFSVAPTVTDDTVQLSFDLQLNQVISRQIVPEASDLKIGRPVMNVRQITATVKVRNGETALAGGFVREEPGNKKVNILLFITPNILPDDKIFLP